MHLFIEQNGKYSNQVKHCKDIKHEIEGNNTYEKEGNWFLFVNSLDNNLKTDKSWFKTIKIEGKYVKFKLGTGTEKLM